MTLSEAAKAMREQIEAAKRRQQQQKQPPLREKMQAVTRMQQQEKHALPMPPRPFAEKKTSMMRHPAGVQPFRRSSSVRSFARSNKETKRRN